jgi:hypothetical protein
MAHCMAYARTFNPEYGTRNVCKNDEKTSTFKMIYSQNHIHYTPMRISKDKFSYIVRFVVFTVVTMKNGVFWDVTACGSCKNRRFGGT